MKLVYLFIILTMGANGLAKNAPNESDEKLKKLPKVYLEVLKKQDIQRASTYFGHLRPFKEVKIYSPIEGFVEEIKVKLGSQLKAGQILAKVRQNVVGLEMMPARIKTPIAGKLYRPQIKENAFVAKNTHLFTVYDPSKYYVEINMSPSDAEQLKTGQKVNVRVKKKSLEGFVDSVSRDVDPQTGTCLVEVVLSGEKQNMLMPGSLGKVTFTFDKREGYLVDKKWIHKTGKGSILRLFDDQENQVQELPIEVVKHIKDHVEIRSSALAREQKIIIKSSVEPLTDKQEVNAVEGANPEKTNLKED